MEHTPIQPERMSPQERKEYSLDLFTRLRNTLLDVLRLENTPDKNRKQTEKLLAGVEETLDLLHKW